MTTRKHNKTSAGPGGSPEANAGPYDGNFPFAMENTTAMKATEM